MVEGPGAPQSSREAQITLRSRSVVCSLEVTIVASPPWGCLRTERVMESSKWCLAHPKHEALDFNCCYYSERRRCTERVFNYSFKKLCVCVCARTCLLSHVRLFAIPWTAACQVPLSRGLSRQEYQSGLPIPSLGDLPDPWTEPASLLSPELADGFFTTSATWRDLYVYVSVFLSVFLRG